MSPENPTHAGDTPRPQRVTKKQQIISLYLSGVADIEDLAMMTNARASYVGKVLQDAGLIHGYFDLYTSTTHPMNVYSRLFAGRLGFKDEATARHSIAVLDQLYEQFARANDHAGQHHALAMALVMFNRARWTGKTPEADLFRQWLIAHLQTDAPPASAPSITPRTTSSCRRPEVE